MAKARRSKSRARGKGGKKGGAGFLMYALPAAAAVAILLWAPWIKADEPKDPKDPKEPIDPPPIDPKKWPPSNLPEGAGFATVKPHNLPGDPLKWNNGLLVHVSPGKKTPLIAPEGVGTVHADTGQQIAILKLGIAVEGEGARRWARVWTKGGGKGYVSQIDPRDGGSNIIVTQEISKEIPEDIGGDLPMGEPIYATYDELDLPGAEAGRALPSLAALRGNKRQRRWSPGFRGY